MSEADWKAILADKHIEVSREYRRQLRQKLKGECIKCPKPVWRPGSQYCRVHQDSFNGYLRKYRRNKHEQREKQNAD